MDAIAIGISISEFEQASDLGFVEGDINRITVELCRRFIALGGSIVLGHQWRPRGVMEAVSAFAQGYESSEDRPVIINYLAWPDRAALSEKERGKLQAVVSINESSQAEPRRQIALRDMRTAMAKHVGARIALGGKIRQPDGFVSGILEEIVLTLYYGKPVYMSRMLGGVTAALIELFEPRGPSLRFQNFLMTRDEKQHEYLEFLATLGTKGLAEKCGLSQPDLEDLFNSQNLDTIVQLTAKGLRTIQGAR
jgi:hypothetical protein